MSIARVNTDYLTGAADAIRRKTGAQEAIPLPQFESEIDNLPSGGTLISKTITENGTYKAEDDNADGYSEVTVAVPREITKLVNGTITEYVDDEVTEIRESAFKNCTSLQKCLIPNVTEIKNTSFYGCASLTDFDFSNVQIMGDHLFYGVPLKKGEPMRFPKLETVGDGCFRNMRYTETPLRMAIYPKLTSITGYSFAGSTFHVTIALLIFKQPVFLTSYGAEMFSIRNNANILRSKIYVPQALLNHFQTATNWAAGYASYPNAIKTIEDNLDYLISLGFTREELLRVDYEEATS